MSYNIFELDQELQEIQKEREEEEARRTSLFKLSNEDRVRIRTAAVQKDIDSLLREGRSVENVAWILGIRECHVKARLGKLEREEEEARRFMQIWPLSLCEGGYLGISS